MNKIDEIKQALQDMYGAQTDEDLMKAYKHIDENSAVWLQWSVSEIERLRKALEKIASFSESEVYLDSEVTYPEIVREISRQALKEGKHE